MDNIKFWRLESPDYESDYDYTYINGIFKHPWGLPGISCKACGQVWASSRILPHSCPLNLRNHKNLKERWPILTDEHDLLKQQVKIAFMEEGIEIDNLFPGDDFQPGFLNVPSKPDVDFLWSSLGSVIVSQRIKDIFERNCFEGCKFVQVQLRNIGKDKPELPAPIPSSGEPEDIFDEVEYLEDTSIVNSYYELIVEAESKRPPGANITSECNVCGRQEYDQHSRLLVMKPDMWFGDDIFLLSTTLWMIVTDKVKQIIESINPTNIRFELMRDSIE